MDLFGNQAKARLWTLQRELELSQNLLTLQREKLALAEARIAAQKDDLKRLLERTAELASRPVPSRSSTPLYMSESEEDIRFMKATEQISIAEAEDMLRQLQFDNETILVDDGLDDTSLF